jgi:hypothetical protein
LEVAVAVFLLLALSGVALAAVLQSASARRAAERRTIALIEATNQLERLTALPFAELKDETINAAALSPQARLLLPGAELKANLADEPGEPSAKRLSVAIHWLSPDGQPDAPVKLTAWVYGTGR